jgi:hypothetical protein
MTKSLQLCTLCLAAAAGLNLGSAAMAADSPHSRSSIGSIFSEVSGPGGANQAGRPAEAEGSKEVTLNRVVDLLREAGLEAEVEGENAAMVKFQHSRWTFPVAISLDADREKVRLEMLLTELSGSSLSAERLMGLLAANTNVQPAFFTFSDKRKRIELVAALPNGLVSAESLREELGKLAAISESTANLWEVAGSTTTAPPAAAAPSAPNNAAVSQPAASDTNSSLVGKWSASRSATEAFAMQLNADGSFVLVYVKDGKQSRSTGKFTAGSGQLTLTTSDGGKFAGGIANISGRSFEFVPQGGKASKLTFQRAS